MKKSHLFWNLVGIALQIALGIYCWQYLLILHIAISIFVAAFETEEIDIPWCFLFTYTTIIVLMWQLIKLVSHGIYMQTIHRFNEWLDTPKVDHTETYNKLRNAIKKSASYTCAYAICVFGWMSIVEYYKGSVTSWVTWLWIFPSMIVISPAIDYWTKYFKDKFKVNKDENNK